MEKVGQRRKQALSSNYLEGYAKSGSGNVSSNSFILTEWATCKFQFRQINGVQIISGEVEFAKHLEHEGFQNIMRYQQ